MNLKTTNIGVVGLGFMGATHIKAYGQVPEARIAAICDAAGRHLDGDFSSVNGNIGSAEPLKLDMSAVSAYRDFNELLANPEIEIVDICAPTEAHAELAIAALRAGKHVLCEKPFARTAAQAQQMVNALQESDKFLMPAMCLRFWPEWAWLKKAITDQPYGKLLSLQFRRLAEPPGWGQAHFHDGKRSGGALLDLHVHDVDFLQFCCGFPSSLFSTGYVKFSGAIDHVLTQYIYPGGPMVTAEGSWALTPGFGFNMAYLAVFEQATADYSFIRGADALRLFQQEKPAETILCPGPDGYVAELAYFIQCVQNGTPPEHVTAANGWTAIQICEAEALSIETGAVVELTL